MGKLTVTLFVSLDGVTQSPGAPSEDPGDGFGHGGWVVPHVDDGMFGFICETYGRASAFLLGRRTYEIFASYWPKVTDASDPVARALNQLPKHVVSTRQPVLSWAGSQLVQGELPGAIRQLKASYDGELQVHGSGGLVQTLLQHDLIDELSLLQFPVVLGSGRRLFGPGTQPAAMKLMQSRSTEKGLVISTYRRDGALRTGAIEPNP